MDPTDGALYCFVSRDCGFDPAICYPQLWSSSTPNRRWPFLEGFLGWG